LKKAGSVTEVGETNRSSKYATEIIIADLKNTTIILENTMSVLLAEPSAKIERSTFESQKMQPEITLEFLPVY
jgi:hypothetical protein